MSRVHDMGGRFGDPAVVPEDEHADRFPEDWHAKALTLTLACGTLGLWNIDISRHARESLAPKDYARFSYYEKWIAALADLLAENGVLSRQELATGKAEDPSHLADRCLRAPQVAGVLARGGPADRPAVVAQKYQPGDTVRTRAAGNRAVPGGHTRLPAYAAGQTGRIVRFQGHHVLPDSNAHGMGEAPEPLYAVAFRAGDLWLHPEHPADEVILDLWQSYLDPA